MFFVYIIKSTEYNWYYVGSTGDVTKRLKEHNAGEVRSTKFRKPYTLLYTEEYDSPQEARRREKAIKQSRYLKTELINMALSSNG